MRNVIGLVAICGIFCGTSQTASAQAWIGAMVGNMVSQQAEAAREAACRSGTPASDKEIGKATVASAALMEGYFALTSKSKPAAFKKLFALKEVDVGWKDPDGSIPVLELGTKLDEPTPALASISFVVGGDAMTARGVWHATYADASLKPKLYAVDFTGGSGSMWGGGWRIWHVTILPEESPPAPPAAYCHFDKDQAW